jgi:hypothetical protein
VVWEGLKRVETVLIAYLSISGFETALSTTPGGHLAARLEFVAFFLRNLGFARQSVVKLGLTTCLPLQFFHLTVARCH